MHIFVHHLPITQTLANELARISEDMADRKEVVRDKTHRFDQKAIAGQMKNPRLLDSVGLRNHMDFLGCFLVFMEILTKECVPIVGIHAPIPVEKIPVVVRAGYQRLGLP